MPKHYMLSELILQVLFPKNFRKIHGFQKKNRPESGRLRFQTGPGSANAALVGIYIHQNDIGTDFPDAVPGDTVVVLTGAKAPQPAGTRYDQSADFSLRDLHFHVFNKSQPPACTDADHFLALQLGYFCCHAHHSLNLLVQHMSGGRVLEQKAKLGFVGQTEAFSWEKVAEQSEVG